MNIDIQTNILDKLILKYESINKDSLFLENEGIFKLSINLLTTP